MVHQVLFADLYLEGDIAHTLRAATAHAPATMDGARRSERIERHAAAHRKMRTDIAAAEAKALEVEAVTPVALVQTLREALSDQTIWVDETITHTRVVQQHLAWEEPKRYFYVQGGLGQGIGVAMGIKMAAPEQPVVLLLGDGTFLYNPIVQALAAARDNGTPLLIVIFNNRKYLSMKFNHLRAYPEGVAVKHNLFHGVDLDTQPPLHRFGEPFGMHGAEVARLADLAPAVRAAAASVAKGTTAILNVTLTT